MNSSIPSQNKGVINLKKLNPEEKQILGEWYRIQNELSAMDGGSLELHARSKELRPQVISILEAVRVPRS